MKNGFLQAPEEANSKGLTPYFPWYANVYIVLAIGKEGLFDKNIFAFNWNKIDLLPMSYWEKLLQRPFIKTFASTWPVKS